MKFSFIGAGKVGCTLGRYLVMHGMEVTGYYDMNIEAADYAAKLTETKSFTNVESIVENSDVIFITVTDSAIGMVWNMVKELDISNKFICHCSGSLTSEIFSDIDRCNAFAYSVHPLFACSSKEESYKDISKAIFTIEGNKEHISDIVDIFKVTGNKTQIISPKDKALYHAAAVVSSNQMIALIQMAVNMLKKCGFDGEDAYNALLPLIRGNVDNVSKQGITGALTGPIERNDICTVDKHLAVLDEDEKLIYVGLSKILVDIAKEKNKDRDYSLMKGRLEDGK